jgi:DNA mismatch repair protein MutL
MSIQILQPEVASQIAAGEVVERPASVVKELVENALDAGARTVTIRVSGAGTRSIEVSDDGSGIPADELSLAVERHATSKLKAASDLLSIRTLGFRGEALASIGSVSRLTLTSRHTLAAAGARLRIEAGQIGRVEPVGSPVGTQVQVEDLFYNVPARLKFLKHDNTERSQIDRLVSRYALAYPKVRFQLSQDDRQTLHTSGNGDRREALGALYSAEIARQMLEILFEDGTLRVSGFISPTSLTRSNRREMTFFVNGRPVQEPALSAAALKGYHTLLMVGRFPIVVLFIEIPPENVDVNVHPAKAEVRFREPERMFSGVQSAVRRGLLAHSPVPGLGDALSWPSPSMWGHSRREFNPTWDWRQATTGGQGPFPTGWGEVPQEEEHPAPGTDQPGLPGGGIQLLRLVGQIANAYLIAEGPDGLYLIDQHAAHERVLFERLIGQTERDIAAQTLLQPASVELPAGSARSLEEQLPILRHLGFDVEAFGPNTFLVRAIPALLKNLEPGAALRALVEDFEEDETPLLAEQERRLAARVCKRAAVKAGQTLSPEEQRSLLNDLESCQSPRTCPHGRPTMIHLSVDLLERQFGRRGPR